MSTTPTPPTPPMTPTTSTGATPPTSSTPPAPAKASTARLPPGPEPVKNNPIALARYFLAFRKDPLGVVEQRFRRYGDLYYVSVGATRLYVTRHPEHFQKILVTENASFKKTETGVAARQLDRLLGRGLVTSNGEFWRRQRRMINPAFARKQLEGYAPVMVERTTRMLDGWSHGAEVEMNDALIRLTLGIVAQTLFDHDVLGENDRLAQLLMSFRELFDVPPMLPDWTPVPSVQRARRALEALNAQVYGLIDERLQSQRAGGAARPDLLSALVNAVDPDEAEGEAARMTRQQLRDELLTLFFAGHETTSHALTWTLYLLARNPEVEARLLALIDAALGGRPPTVEDLGALAYAEQVIKEAMRSFSPVPAISRTATADVEVGGYTIPEGAEVVMWLRFAHLDPRWYPDPERFDPERFTPDAERALPPGAYLPFGGGQRTCIGKRFALMEATLILVTLLQRYRLILKPHHEPGLDPRITLAPRRGMPMIAVARERHHLA